MLNVLKSDLYRIKKFKPLHLMTVFTIMLSLFLVTLIRQDIRLGVSIIGNLTIFKNITDVVLMGVNYQKGLGIFVAILISMFIGQEYLWKTWKHKWIASNHRSFMYLSKVIVSITLSTFIFLTFEVIILIYYSPIQSIVTKEYLLTILCGIFIYATLGSIICFFSILIKNNIVATIVSVCYILLSETFISVIKVIFGLSKTAINVFSWLVNHSIQGMRSLVYSNPISTDILISISINSIIIIALSTIIGITIFKKYEL